MNARFPLLVSLALAGSTVLLSQATASEPGPHHPAPPPPPKSGLPKPPVHPDPPKPAPPDPGEHALTQIRGVLSGVDVSLASVTITPAGGSAVTQKVGTR